MQDNIVFKYLSYLFKGFLVFSFLLSLLQNYLSDTGTVEVIGYTFTQFYPHTDRRILPLLILSVITIPLVKKWFGLKGNFYFSDMLLTFLCSIDAFTHVNGFYDRSFFIPFYGEVWFDKITHFLEGLLLLPVFLPFTYRYFLFVFDQIRAKALSYFVTVGLISIFFVLWEILELFIDQNFSTTLITSPTDTNEDLLFAYGGFIISFAVIELYHYLYNSLDSIKGTLLSNNKMESNVST